MAFSGVTSVKFTAAPGRIKRTEKKERHKEEKRKDETEKGERMRQVYCEGYFFPDNCREIQIPVFDVCSLTMKLKVRILCFSFDALIFYTGPTFH